MPHLQRTHNFKSVEVLKWEKKKRYAYYPTPGVRPCKLSLPLSRLASAGRIRCWGVKLGNLCLLTDLCPLQGLIVPGEPGPGCYSLLFHSWSLQDHTGSETRPVKLCSPHPQLASTKQNMSWVVSLGETLFTPSTITIVHTRKLRPRVLESFLKAKRKLAYFPELSVQCSNFSLNTKR